jgi:hypothetical protein
MTSKCGYEFFCICFIHPVGEMFSKISEKWTKTCEDYDESDLWALYDDCKKHKYEKTNAEAHILAKMKEMIRDTTLTAEQEAKVVTDIKTGWATFITETPVHYCGEEECDGLCGVQPCGVCIDRCRCWDEERRWR